MADSKAPGSRFAFIDWTRGLAGIVMLQGHTFDSFARPDLRSQGPFIWSQFLGGLPPAIFLFLTGMTFAFLMDGQEKRQASAGERVIAALKRSRYLFLIAFLFRIQLFVFGYPTSPASELLRVDILNCMGMAMLIFAPMAVFSTYERIKLCMVLGIFVAGVAPIISMLDLSGIPAPLRNYFVPSYKYFAFFPWAAFLAFGMAGGSALRKVNRDDLSRAMLWTLGFGMVLIMGARYASNLPHSIYPKSDFWLNSPGLILIKTGIVLIILAVAYVWVHFLGLDRWSLCRQLGTTSLLVYWVHIEIVYGRWLGSWKNALSVPQIVVFTVLLLGLLTLLSLGRTRLKPVGAFFRAASLPQPKSASGD